MVPPPSIFQWNARQKLGELQYHLASNDVPILAIFESRLRPGTRLQPYVRYHSDPRPTPGQLPSVSLIVHKIFD